MRTNPRSLALATLLCLAPTLVPRAALAQSAPDPTLQAAHDRFAEGVDFYDKGQFENARAAFLQAYALHKHPAVLINLAQSSLRSGHTLDADRYFTRYIKESNSLTPEQRAEADKGLAEARTKLGRIDVLAASGVAVTIDAELAGTDGSTTLDVEPGQHTVKGGPDTESVTVAAGQTVVVKLGKGGAPPPAVAVVPVPAATPAEPAPTPPETTPPPPPAEESKPGLFSPPATTLPVWVGAGVGFAGFLTAIIFGVLKGNAQDEYNSQATTIMSSIKGNSTGACLNPKTVDLMNACGNLNSDGSDVSADATAANVGVVVGIVGVGFAAGWYLFAPKKDTAKPSNAAGFSPSVQPMLGPHVGGLNVGASF
jgi:hypothetical protein